jgi:hypothetical protein
MTIDWRNMTNRPLRLQILAALAFWASLLAAYGSLTAALFAQVQVARDDPFYIYRDAGMPGTNHYVPSGLMGDTGDIVVNEGWSTNPYSGKTSIRIQYDPKLKGPSKCDNYAPPCRWAGVYWQEPANNWGTNEKFKDSGYDLSEYTVLKFWAKTDTHCEEKCLVKFTVGGIDERYGDSLKSGRSVEAHLSDKWCPFEVDLRNAKLHHIIGGFTLSVAQRDYPQGITMYLDEIRFEKK